MQVERHVFGSVHGYTTLAKSAGVSGEDCRTIESAVYGFGQTYDPAFYESLRRNPTFFTRILSGNRRSFTLVTEGDRDDNSRPTLRFMTAILTRRDWDAVLLGDLAQLIRHRELWKWDGARELAVMQMADPHPRLRISGRHVPAVLQLLSQIERSYNTHKPLIVSEIDFGPEELRAVEMLLPISARGMFTSACRAISPFMPASIVSVFGEAPQPTFRRDPAAPLSPYALALKAAGLEKGIIPLGLVVQYAHFGSSAPQELAKPAQPSAPPESLVSVPGALAPTPARPSQRWPIATAGVCGLAIGFVAGVLLMQWKMSEQPSQVVQVNRPKVHPTTTMSSPTTQPAEPSVLVLPTPASRALGQPTTTQSTAGTLVSSDDQELTRLRALEAQLHRDRNRRAATEPTTQPAPSSGKVNP